jgi:hypothetical protein
MKAIDIIRWIRKNKYIKYALVFLLGVFADYVRIEINNYVNRPDISISLRSITIREENNWSTDVRFRINNSGGSGTTVLLENIELFFPEYSNRPFSLKADRFSKIESKSTVGESLTTVFPSVFDTLTMEQIPKLDKIILVYRTIETNKDCYLTIKSEDIIYSSGFGLEHHGPEYLKDVKIDTVKGMIGLETKEFPIEYEGKSYLNNVYPKTTSVQYKIENEKIILQYSGAVDKIADPAASQLIEPVIFIPHPYLKDKIVYPKNMSVRFTIECMKKDKITFEDYEVNIGQREKTLLYIIK